MKRQLIKLAVFTYIFSLFFACIGGDDSNGPIVAHTSSSQEESSSLANDTEKESSENQSSTEKNNPSSTPSESSEESPNKESSEGDSKSSEDKESSETESTTTSSSSTKTESSSEEYFEPISVDDKAYDHCEEDGITIKPILCTQYFDAYPLREKNTLSAILSGEIHLSLQPQTFNYLAQECRVCKGGDTLMITDAELTLAKDHINSQDQIVIPLKETIKGADPVAKTFYQKFVFDIMSSLKDTTEFITQPHRFHVKSIRMWNEDESYILVYAPDKFENGHLVVPADSILDWVESDGGKCSHPACLN